MIIKECYEFVMFMMLLVIVCVFMVNVVLLKERVVVLENKVNFIQMYKGE